MPPHPRVVPRAGTAAACLLATIAIGGCASGVNRADTGPVTPQSTPGHPGLTDRQFAAAVAVARAEVDREEGAVLTSATVTIGAGTVTQTNVGPPCTSGALLHIKLIGTFPHITIGGPSEMVDHSVSALLITADAESGKACLISDEAAEAGAATPDPGAVLLFTK